MYYNYLSLEYQHKLYKLRDKVRMYAIDKKIKQHDIFFDYMDSSVCVTIKQMPNLNIITTIFLFYKHRNENRIQSFNKMISSNVQTNEYAKELYDEYGNIISEYLSKKHYIIGFSVNLLGRALKGIISLNKGVSLATDAIKSVRIYPETSAAYMVL